MSCFICRRLLAGERHHVNWDHSDDSLRNVVRLCRTCHVVVHQVGWNCLEDLERARSAIAGKQVPPERPGGEPILKEGFLWELR